MRRVSQPPKPIAFGLRSLRLGLVWGVLLCIGCTSPRQWVANGFKVGPNYQTPCAPVTHDWIDADDKRVLDDPVQGADWWATSFNDPVLNELVAEAYNQNLTVQQAGARIMQARALRQIAIGGLFPQQQALGASYSHNLTTGAGFDRHFSSWSGSFGLAWEVDFWGRYRRAVEAADADLDAAVFEYGDVVVTLVADVAATYIDIRTLQTRLELVKLNVENQRQTYDITEIRFKNGESSEVDVQQAKSSLVQTEALVPQVETTLRQSQNQLCVLLGMPPEEILELLGPGKIPTVKSEIALGIPAASLLQRPDVRRAERQLAAQSALIGVAESDLYPHITLSGTVGRRGNQFKELFRSGSGFGSVGPSLDWNILNYGRILGDIEFQEARFQELLVVYQQSVLVANQEAEDAIVQFLKSQELLRLQLEAAEAADKTNELITLQYAEGEEIDFNRVFNVQNTKTQQEVAAATAKGNVAQGVVAIYRSLGGGWPSPYLGQPLGVTPEPAGEEIEPPAGEEIPIDEVLENPVDEIPNNRVDPLMLEPMND
ncbi:efflux transporter outer membrane subunit [Blastopirellula retiformator]|uniref:Toluene efflux pump outer membrane protein TtgF n=1 Tax=Blastopirellula retiformator TaxID=2527970 RepID=A0A5C5V763_9BACT|nr:efflux transporter outer membrane subunit [Blastopirellula retiformator]TWT34408.1 Toluene efflux pump outer membrane protein TtgF precursor [Blastopirellula retiformator]